MEKNKLLHFNYRVTEVHEISTYIFEQEEIEYSERTDRDRTLDMDWT